MTAWTTSARAATETPASRDRVIDLLRVGSLVVVVFGHVLMVVVRWRGDQAHVTNLLVEVPELKVATWALQVMPLFFAAGAMANRLSYRSACARGEAWRVWLWHRVRRLTRPVVYYLAAWVCLVAILSVVYPDAAAALAKLATQLLWFLGAYLFVVATTQWQIRLAEHGFGGIGVLLAAIALVDLARFHLLGGIALLNFLVVWFMAATLGLVVRDRIGRGVRAFAAAALGALVVNIVLVATLSYPISMVGMPGDRISNMAPPTMVLALHSVVLICVIGMLWPALDRFCARPAVWRAVALTAFAAMSLYLWHLTALLLVTVIEHGLGIPRGHVDEWSFWIGALAHVVVVLLAVVLVVVLVAPLEHTPVPWFERAEPDRPGGRSWNAVAFAAVVACGAGLLVLAATGMGGFPFSRVTHYAGLPLTPGLGFALVVVGLLTARAAGRRVEVLRSTALDVSLG